MLKNKIYILEPLIFSQ